MLLNFILFLSSLHIHVRVLHNSHVTDGITFQEYKIRGYQNEIKVGYSLLLHNCHMAKI